MEYRNFWLVMAFIVCLVGFVASYGWLADTVKYGGFIALGAFAITARLLKFAFSNVDPNGMFSLRASSNQFKSCSHNHDITDPRNPASQNPYILGSVAWMRTTHDDHTD